MKFQKNCILILAGLMSVMACNAELPARATHQPKIFVSQSDKENLKEPVPNQGDSCIVDSSSFCKSVIKGVAIHMVVGSVVVITTAVIMGAAFYYQIKNDSNQRKR
jgi:hypothetical protein